MSDRSFEIEKLKALGFNIENMSSNELDDLKKCFITISESEGYAFSELNNKSQSIISASNRNDEDNKNECSLKESNNKYYNYSNLDNYDDVKSDLKSCSEYNKSFNPQQYNNNVQNKNINNKIMFTNNKLNKNTYSLNNNNNKSLKENALKKNVSNIKTFDNYNSKSINNKHNIQTKSYNKENKQMHHNKNSNAENNIHNENYNFSFNNATIDDEYYLKLKSKDPSKLNKIELYLIKVYEKFDNLNSELKHTKKQYYQYRNEKLNLEEENSILKLEKEKVQKINKDNIEIINIKLSSTETEYTKLKELCDNQEKKLLDSIPKVQRYNELSLINEKLSKEIEENKELINKVNSLNQSLQKEKQDLISKYENLRFENESLNRDKIYLNKELLIKDEKNLSLTEKVKNLESEIQDIRKTNHKYIDKLTDKTCYVESMYQEKLKTEINDIKNKYNLDLENLKKMYEDLNNCKTEHIIEERNDLKIKLKKLEFDLSEKNKSFEFINNEFRNLKIASNEDISCLKIQNKLKIDENERISNMYDSNLALLKLAKAENDSLKEKYDLLRNELINREAGYKEDTCNLKAELAILKESKAHYDKMEDELDKVIIDSNINEGDQDIMAIVKDIPSSSKRRINQCLILAQKLKNLTIENEKLSNKLNSKDDEINKVLNEKEVLRELVEKSKQPYSYLIKRIEELELDILKYKQDLAEKESNIKRLINENELQENKIEELQSDLKSVLKNRKKLENIEEAITKISGVGNSLNTNNQMDVNSLSSQQIDTNKLKYNSIKINQSYNNNLCKNNVVDNPKPLVVENNSILKDNYNKNIKDNSIDNSDIQNYSKIEEVPQWYINLKIKKAKNSVLNKN